MGNERNLQKSAVIAVYNEEAHKTVLYLHAREVYVSKDDLVIVGSPLGIQGNTGLGKEETDITTAEHVHIEVQEGESITPSRGTEDMGDAEREVYPTIDPIQYLYDSVKSSAEPDDQTQYNNLWDLTLGFLTNLFSNDSENEGGGIPLQEDEVVTIGKGQIFIGNLLVLTSTPFWHQ